MRPPSISVVVPAYNAGRWIEDTLRSVLDQTLGPRDIIVVDDGSTDDTAERAARFGEVVTVVAQPNGGPPAAYNRGFELATGEYVAMCPADDLWEPRKLEWQAETLAANPDVDIVFGGADFFGLRDGEHPHPSRPGLQDNSGFLREMYRDDLIAAPTAVVRRELHQRLGRFDESLPSEDYEFWLRALCDGARFYYEPRLLVRLRVHGGNVSLRALEITEMNHQLRERYADAVGDPDLVKRLLAQDLRVIARCHFGAGSPDDARSAYAKSMRYTPSVEAAAGALLLASPGLSRALTRVNRTRHRLRGRT
jgi:glycosyltransferase involved in cell wall biosynthesis